MEESQRFGAEFADYVHRVLVPADIEPAAWARAHATVDPEIVPSGWPESPRMCLVVIYRNCDRLDHDCQTRIFLVTRPEAMHHLATHVQRLGVPMELWFRLPRRLFTAEVCPTLRAEHWPPEEDVS